MKKPIYNAYFDDVYFNFMVHEDSRDTIILLAGFPSVTDKREEIKYFFEKGYNVFFPRYKGTLQSHGKFLDSNIVQDINNFINKIKEGKAIELWEMKEVNFQTKNIFIVAGSFGGSIALGLSAINPDIKKMILFAPVWDFKKQNELGDEEDDKQLIDYTKRAFQYLFRFDFDDFLEEISKVQEVFPDFYLPKIKIPLLVFHDPNDLVVNIRHSKAMQEKLNFQLIKHDTGHSGDIGLLENNWNNIESFLKN